MTTPYPPSPQPGSGAVPGRAPYPQVPGRRPVPPAGGPRHGAAEHGAPAYGGPQYGANQYGQYGAPGYGGPQDQTPRYGAQYGSYPPPVPPQSLLAPAPALAPMPGAATGQAVKRRHPLAVWLGLPLITLGIYGLVWYYKIHREMADLDRRREVPVAGPLLVIIFLSWTVVAPLVSFYNTGRRIADAQRSAGLVPTANPWIGVLLCFAFGLQTLYYQMELNRIADHYGVPAGTLVPLAG